jgi:hypothetical protein
MKGLVIFWYQLRRGVTRMVEVEEDETNQDGETATNDGKKMKKKVKVKVNEG